MSQRPTVSRLGNLALTGTHEITFVEDRVEKRLNPSCGNPQALVREQAAMDLLGRSCSLSDDGTILTMPNLGQPLDLPRDWGIEMGGVLADLHQQAGVKDSTLPAGGWVEEVWTKVTTRLATLPDHSEVRWLLAWAGEQVDTLADGEPHDDLVLIHGDPHPGNWLQGPVGGLVLIDFESARWGPAEFDLATLRHSFVLMGQEDYWRTLRSSYLSRRGLDPERLAWSLRLKTVLGMSWSAWRFGPEEIRRRRTEVLPDLMARF